MARKVRKDAGRPAREYVRMSVPVTVETHARLCFIAARRRVDRAELAASFVAAALKHVSVAGAATVPGDDPADDAGDAA